MLVISIYKSGLKSTEQIIENKPTVTICDKKRISKKREQQYCQCHVALSALKFQRILLRPSQWMNYIYQTKDITNFIITVWLKKTSQTS